MVDGNIVGDFDVAKLALIAFFLFFLTLVFYLRREDRREGYPLEDPMTGHIDFPGGPLSTAEPKTFNLPFGKGTATAPPKERDPFEVAGKRREPFPGAPYFPTGNPLEDGMGPAAFANRAKYPDMTAHGTARIVPISLDGDISVAPLSTDPRGLKVIAADGAVAGTITDLWVDRAEHLIRYLEVDIGEKKVLAPMAMAVVRKDRVMIDAINAADYVGVPALASGEQITRYEEERVVAYFGGGYLYANQRRQEPFV